MKNEDSATESRPIALGGLGGAGQAALGVLVFSFSLPATVYALDGLDPYLIGVGRAVVAALLGAVALAAVRARPPALRYWPGLLAVGFGVVFGFPVLSTLALDHGASAAHGAVLIGLLPAATAIFAVLRTRERPSPAFWAAAAVGALTITAFTLAEGGGTATVADLLLVGALVTAAYGYAEGGRLAREMPGWRVISWALVLAAPVSVPVTAVLLATTEQEWTARSVIGFGYVSAFSMFLGFFAWYAGMARIGVAKAGQFQLAQPILTLAWSTWLLGERLGGATWPAAIIVVACVAWTQRARVRTAPAVPARPVDVASR
ncbi:Permease of the drug/metabolite transporter (DMT) superfamily [Thermomonospora echinospora]|uniref:Permease of the drug/metabolite transporter (DMT) superfamily n=1 Tax=Thermomonospora echinospora TaxID=1992 RepID=A0A1H6BLD0_9ACTN|nr:DMT family transporter [Thermomonospora echinospora]SEG61529.1 Permease of the drug/metabolite transporter (DMT) superfamily [Thermomonospora echinospora]